MTEISYFQRYSQPENHATNNTLLVLRYLYQRSPVKLQRLLISILEDSKLTVGVSFSQQRKGKASVPDGYIEQEPFRLYVEAKRGGELDDSQIARHLTTIGHEQKEGAYYLLALTKEPLNQSRRDAYVADAKKAKVVFVNVTFSGLVAAIREQCEEFEQELLSIISDYENFLSQDGLLEVQSRWLVVVPCGTSMAENRRFGIYYEPDTRPSKAHYRYLGLYNQKAVRSIGTIEAVMTFDGPYEKAEPALEKGIWQEGYRQRVCDIVAQSAYYDLTSGHRFYLVDTFADTMIHKISPGGIMGIRYLSIAQLLSSKPVDAAATEETIPSGAVVDTHTIAKKLNNKTWQ